MEESHIGRFKDQSFASKVNPSTAADERNDCMRDSNSLFIRRLSSNIFYWASNISPCSNIEGVCDHKP